jgi:hypothetical protein
LRASGEGALRERGEDGKERGEERGEEEERKAGAVGKGH